LVVRIHRESLKRLFQLSYRSVSADVAPVRSARRDELLERAYAHVLEHGIAAMSLRPLAREIGSSPRVLLYLFGSKDGLVRALLSRARIDELVQLRERAPDEPHDLATTVAELWAWLAAPEHGGLLRLWVEAYGRSLVEPNGPWAGFARATVEDWLDLLSGASNPTTAAQRTLALAVLRGAFLDLLASGDGERTGAAVALALVALT
jgi:AcrR family transcriptional regulator